MIRAVAALSTRKDSGRAAFEAAGKVARALGGQAADWCVAFVTGEHAGNMKTMLESVSGILGTPHVVGCSASGVLTADTEVEEGPAIGLMAVTSDQIRATPFIFGPETDHGLTAGVRIGRRLVQSRDSTDTVLVWPDPFTVRPDHLLHGIDAVLGNVAVVGGAASVAGPEETTFQFCGDVCTTGAVTGLRLGGRFNAVVGVTQGCAPLGERVRVTRAHENMILEIDDRPAYEVLREQVPPDLGQDLEGIFRYLFVGLLPDATERDGVGGDYLIRNIVSADPDTGVVAIADRVEEGHYMVFAQREPEAARADLQRMLAGVHPEKTGLEYRFGLYFNCLARGRSLHRADGIDSSMIAEAFPDLPVLGFFCNAEIGPLKGVNQLFTYTGVLLLIAE